MSDAVPTWESPVRSFFEAEDVRRMREIRADFDLGDYDFVKRHAETILRSVTPSASDPSRSSLGISIMPPPPREPWTESKRRLFAAWADAGCPRNAGSVLPPPSQLQEFLALSRALTGFDDLSASLAGRYLTTARADRARKAELDELLALVAESGPSGALMAQHEVLCTYLVLLWYSGAQFGENGFVEDAGEPWRNEYREGLVWRACLAHPMGYSLEPYGHWGDAPDESGLHTGMGAAVDE